jgi:SAM-dependent methyltransferase
MAVGDFEKRGMPRRPAFDLLEGYVMCSVLASLDDAGTLSALAEHGLTVDEVGGNRQLARDTLLYLVDRGVVAPDGERYRLTGYGHELLHDKGFVSWIAGGFAEPFKRFKDLVAGTHHYGSDIVRDGRIVAVSSADLGMDNLRPYVHEILSGIEYKRAADLGCGNARNLIGICAIKNAEGVGVDISPEAVEQARLELAKDGLTDQIEIYEADASDAAALPRLEEVDLVVGFFFMHEVLGQGLEAFIAFLRGMAARLPAGAHVLAAEVLPPERDRAAPETFTPEFTLIHALMGQGLLSEQGWCDAFRAGGFEIEKTVRPNIPGGLLLLARRAD